MDPYIGEIRPFAFSYVPENWLFCNGQQVSVQQYPTLYAVIGNTYGGNNQVFNLPDLRGRAAVGPGVGPGLTPRNVGNNWGTETVTLSVTQMPSHTHTASAEQEGATTPSPQSNIVAAVSSGPSNTYFYKATPQQANLVQMNGNTVSPAGSGQPHENRQPYLVLNFCICCDGGIFPVRP